MNDVTFLLGAGASIPLSPTTNEITDQLKKSPSTWIRTFDKGIPFGLRKRDDGAYSSEAIAEMEQLCKLLTAIIQQLGENASYEEIYSVARQVWAHLSKEHENGAVGPFVDLLVGTCGFSPKELQKVCGSLCELIACIVRAGVGGGGWFTPNRRSAKCNSDFNHNLLVNVVRIRASSQIHILTTNFDRHIEKALEVAILDYGDGFEANLRSKNQVHLWSAQFDKGGSTRVALYKLHGSIDWLWVRDPQGKTWLVKTNVATDYDELDREMTILPNSSILLSGSINKLLTYNYGPYLDLLLTSRAALLSSSLIIVAGYGFTDDGINLRLIDAMMQDKATMVVIDPDPAAVRRNARGAIHSRFGGWELGGRLRFIAKCMSDTSADEVLNPEGNSRV